MIGSWSYYAHHDCTYGFEVDTDLSIAIQLESCRTLTFGAVADFGFKTFFATFFLDFEGALLAASLNL